MKTWNEISPFTGLNIDEDAPTNSAGSGSVAGLGIGHMGEPGVKKKKKRTLIDARSKAYREHRKRLESSRLKRQEAMAKRSKFTEKVTSEMTYGSKTLGATLPQADMSNKDMDKDLVNAEKKKKSKTKKKSQSDEKNN
jgi:hypothetical protein